MNNGNTAIPTKYAGTEFRSRIEARWACFFDLVGWRWEYEPIDLPGWIPDFILSGRTEVLVEVKSTTTLDGFDQHKMGNALRDSDWARSEVLLLGRTPALYRTECFAGVGLGWIFNDNWTSDDTGPGVSEALWIREHQGHGLDFCSDLNDYQGRLSGFGNESTMGGYPVEGFDEHLINEWWTNAGNQTRWKRPAVFR